MGVLPPHPVFWALLHVRSHLSGSEGFAIFPPYATHQTPFSSSVSSVPHSYLSVREGGRVFRRWVVPTRPQGGAGLEQAPVAHRWQAAAEP